MKLSPISSKLCQKISFCMYLFCMQNMSSNRPNPAELWPNYSRLGMIFYCFSSFLWFSGLGSIFVWNQEVKLFFFLRIFIKIGPIFKIISFYGISGYNNNNKILWCMGVWRKCFFTYSVYSVRRDEERRPKHKCCGKNA